MSIQDRFGVNPSSHRNFKIWCGAIYRDLIWVGCSNSRGRSHLTAIQMNQPKKIIARTKSEDSTIIAMAVVDQPPASNASTPGQSASTTSSPRSYQTGEERPAAVTDQGPLRSTKVTFVQMQDVPDPRPVVSTRYPALFAGCQNGELVVYSLREGSSEIEVCYCLF